MNRVEFPSAKIILSVFIPAALIAPLYLPPSVEQPYIVTGLAFDIIANRMKI